MLHTSDWHVGKQIRGNSRADEHRAVLREIVAIAEQERVDLVLVVGDLWDTAAPSPEAEGIVFDTLIDLARVGARVAVVGGNHDNARRLTVYRPLLAACGVDVIGEATRPDAGGCLRFTAADGADVVLALLPFVSQRGIVKAEQLLSADAHEHALEYAHRMRRLLEVMCGSFGADTVNVLMAHAFVLGGATGGGERPAHLVQEYAVQAQAFPVTASYVALGHLHKPQQIPGAAPIHYCGSPLQLDFGEVEQDKQVNVVEVEPGRPARLTPRPLRAGRRLRAYRGTFDELRAAVVDDDAWLRLTVREQQRAGLGQQVREAFGDRVVEVRIESPADRGGRTGPERRNRTPHELLAEYMRVEGVDDQRVIALFDELLDNEAGEVA